MIANQDLLGSIKNVTSSLPNVSLSNINPSAILSNVTNAINQVNSTLGGVIPTGIISNYLPSNLDFSKVADVQNLLGKLNSSNFDLANPEMIPDLKNLTSSERCISRLSKLMTYMSMAEQVAFFSAYKTTKSNSTAEDSGRCFAPRILKKTFRQINKGNMKEMGKKMSEVSKNIRNSFGCVSKSFKKLKISANYKEDLESFSKTQGTTNQCKSTFMRTLTQTLARRRRYLLLTEKDSNSTAITDSDGKIEGFSWLKSEVETITKAFLTFADCFQALPDSLTKTFANVLSKISQDPVCNSETSRLLQTNTTNTTTTKSAEIPKNSTIAPSGSVSNAIPSGSASNAIPSGSASNAIPSGSVSNAIPSGSASGRRPKKPKSIGYITFSETAITQLNSISTNLMKKTGDYQAAGKLITGFLSETQLMSQCNLPGLMKSFLSEKSDEFNKIATVEMKKLAKNEVCTSDYLVYVEKAKGGSSGKINCTDADKKCVNASFTAKSVFDNANMVLVTGCISGERLYFGYIEDPEKGKALNFKSKNVETCVKGESNKCAKEFAKMKKSGKRLLQTESTCSPKMKASCSETVKKNCADSNLFEEISENQPSATDRALPDECLNIDPENPDYTKCFIWINKNLIAFSIFPKIDKVEDIQSLINQSQSLSLRFLQAAEIKIVESDASSNDPVAKLPEDQITLTASDVEIDGSNPEKISSTASVVAEIEASTSEDQSNAGNFNKLGFALIPFVLAIIFN
jgi:hypothetical protein